LARKVLGRLAPYGGLFVAAIAQVLAIGFLELAKPWPLKVIVDNVIGGRPLAWPWVSALGARGLLAAACGALVGVYALLGALGVVPVLFLSIVGMSRRMNALASDSRVKESALWAVAQRTMGAIRVIQAFTTEEAEHRRFVRTSTESLAATLRLYTFQTSYSG